MAWMSLANIRCSDNNGIIIIERWERGGGQRLKGSKWPLCRSYCKFRGTLSVELCDGNCAPAIIVYLIFSEITSPGDGYRFPFPPLPHLPERSKNLREIIAQRRVACFRIDEIDPSATC